MKLLHLINNLISTDTREPEPKGKWDDYKGEKVEVIFEDGSKEIYPRHLEIIDGKNCAVCIGKAYHLHLDCKGLMWEESQCSSPIRGMSIKAAKKAGMHLCQYCYEENREKNDYNEDIDSDD